MRETGYEFTFDGRTYHVATDKPAAYRLPDGRFVRISWRETFPPQVGEVSAFDPEAAGRIPFAEMGTAVLVDKDVKAALARVTE